VGRLSMASQVVHAGEGGTTHHARPLSTPIYNTVSYTYESAQRLDAVFSGEREGYVYTRFGNPTVGALESAVAQLEGTEAAIATASGMAALHLALVAAGAIPGKTIVAARDLYGGTLALLHEILEAQGVKVVLLDMTRSELLNAALHQHAPAVVLMETISNPLLRVADVPEVTRLAHEIGARVVVDNTFATPCLYRPALQGVDFVVHSATKYLGGHGDVTGGVIATSAENRASLLRLLKLMGCILGPNEAWLVLRGLKTLVLRTRQQCENADVVARYLASDQRMRHVHYPGLPSHPDYALCRRLFPVNMWGGMVSFEIAKATQSTVFRFMDRLRLVVPATSLGDVTSLVLYPAQSSHRGLSEEERSALGITPGLLRLSVGIEDAADIVADLRQALDTVDR
jgi:cystathionine beta-lyase/cystathionine gamma-synthase